MQQYKLCNCWFVWARGMFGHKMGLRWDVCRVAKAKAWKAALLSAKQEAEKAFSRIHKVALKINSHKHEKVVHSTAESWNCLSSCGSSVAKALPIRQGSDTTSYAQNTWIFQDFWLISSKNKRTFCLLLNAQSLLKKLILRHWSLFCESCSVLALFPMMLHNNSEVLKSRKYDTGKNFNIVSAKKTTSNVL